MLAKRRRPGEGAARIHSLAARGTAKPMILVENGPAGQPALFRAPSRVIRADSAREVDAALDALDAARAGGRWLAGYASYELGYALEPRLAPLMPAERRGPLLK